MLGNIKFIGELYRLSLLHESIVHQCIKQLINKKKKGTVDDLAEDLECLCQIMTTCGRRLDHEKAKSLMDQYFDRIEKLQRRKTELPSRIRFMLQDVIELRAAGWVPRSIHVHQGPKTLGEIRQEVGEDHPHLLFDPHSYKQGNQRQDRHFKEHHVAAGLGFFPMSKKQQYDGFGMPSSPPSVPLSNGEPTSPGRDFDFFSSPPSLNGSKEKRVTKQTAAPGQFIPPYMNQHNNNHMQQAYMPPAQYQQQQPMYNGYPVHYPNQGYAQPTSMTPSYIRHPNVVPAETLSETLSETNKPSKAKQGRVLPPRFMKHRHANNHDSSTDGDLGYTNPVSNTAKVPDQPQGKPTYSSATNSTNRSYSPKNSFRGSPTNVKPNPITPATADTFQPPYQHVLDRAQNQPIRKSNSNPNFEKSKAKKIVMNEKEVIELIDSLLLNDKKEELHAKIKAAKIPKKHMTLVCGKLFMHSINGSDSDRDKMCSIMKVLLSDGVLLEENLQEAVTELFEKFKDLESDFPRIKSLMASLLSHAMSHDIITLDEIAKGLEGGYHFPLFLLMLQHLTKIHGRDWLSNVFTESKVEMLKMMPEVSQNKASMLEILEMKNLSFLFPLLHMEARLAAQLDTDATPQVVYRWIKENVDQDLHSDPGFISVLITSCLQHITKNASLAPEIDRSLAVTKEVQEKEKALLSGIKVVLQKFIHDKPDLQLRALYAVQVFCHGAKFPKGLMLRLFDLLYHEDIIDEEIFLKWKEDVNDEYPGKGKSLFQVNSWLTWLEEADTEDDEEDG
uniref:Eukaryotic translation initiation factor 4 gamma 2 n=1 Tax=Phallusia mammillata TaxID=59560 RepID=A0A6F9DB85_9ASCI|nr:eukaryotic translation initiation factor 4 gamma 2 [Phallusia mammillata]